MIHVEIVRDNNHVCGFDVHGHSGYAAHGSDIVCAGVSALTQGALLALQHDGKVSFQHGCGRLSVEIDKPDLITDAIILAMIKGIEEIAKKYPNFVEIKGG